MQLVWNLAPEFGKTAILIPTIPQTYLCLGLGLCIFPFSETFNFLSKSYYTISRPHKTLIFCLTKFHQHLIMKMPQLISGQYIRHSRWLGI